jgi:hypothetical protein
MEANLRRSSQRETAGPIGVDVTARIASLGWLAEKGASVVGEGLRVQVWAVGPAELIHPISGCGRVGTVPPRLRAVEEIHVPRVLA